MLAVVHDLAEAQGESSTSSYSYVSSAEGKEVGDIAPRENIPKEEKRRLEAVSCVGSITCSWK